MGNKKGYLYLFLVAFFFGISYIFQELGSNYLDPFTFSAFRFLVAGVTLLPFIKEKSNFKKYFKESFKLALVLFAAALFQQSVAGHSESGKIGFITSLYVVFVPVMSFLFYGRKINKKTLLSILLALFGLMMLCEVFNFNVNPYDFLVLFTALAYSFEILFVDSNTDILDYYAYFAQAFLMTSAMFFILVFIFIGNIDYASVRSSAIPIVYDGICAGCVSYILQIKGQALVNETSSSIIMSFESVIAIVSGIIVMKESFTVNQLMGCFLMFVSLIICILSEKS